MFPHAECNKFYHCAHGRTFIKNCPSGTVFDPKLQICNWPHAVDCPKTTTTTTTTTTTAKATTTTLNLIQILQNQRAMLLDVQEIQEIEKIEEDEGEEEENEVKRIVRRIYDKATGTVKKIVKRIG
ncbi:Oidioi.mRNA.OKI2018_I69.chr2.g4985.t1.cds [Oikopleura dioica]|uniref:chitinase n=1 Tax=Oikopleura dioica TaxID=34765 RepID=A0ABN7T4T4_OIKDI|nr:Oidioi.mRNA.OKI2018_I69.chr2.g4985.t1.cds [Oikopleura dioica]